MGLFGLSPEDVQTLQQQGDVAQAQNAAQLPLGSGGVYASSIAGNMLGRGVAGALGYQNPQMVKAQKFQQAMNETESSGIDYNRDPVGYLSTGVRNLMKYGLPEQAMVMADKLKEAQQGQLYQAQAGHQAYQTQLSMEGQKRGQEIANAYPNDLPRQAAALMADPLTRDAGIKLRDDLQKAQTQKYQPLTEYGVLNTQTGETVGGGAAHTELGKYQAQQASLQSALKAATSQGQPKEVIDGIQKNLDETENKIKLLSEGRPRNVMVERATATLTEQLSRKLNGEELTRADYIKAIAAQGAVEMGVHAVMDPNTGTTTFVQNSVPSDYSVQTLYGGKVPGMKSSGGQSSFIDKPTSGMSANPVPGQVTHTRIGNADVTSVQGPGARPAEAEVKILSEADALKGTLSDIGKIYNPDWVGPVSGRVGAFKQEYTGQSEKGRALFIQKTQIYYDRLIKFITGAQMSEAETKRLVKEVPVPTDPHDVFESKLNGVNDVIEYTVKAYQQNMRQGGTRVIGGNPVSPNQQPIVRPANIGDVTGTPLSPAPNTRGGFNYPEGQAQKAAPMLPPNIPPIEQRELDKKYVTPKGVLRWTKDGWVKP